MCAYLEFLIKLYFKATDCTSKIELFLSKIEEKAWRERTWGKSVGESLINLRFERKAGEKRDGGSARKSRTNPPVQGTT